MVKSAMWLVGGVLLLISPLSPAWAAAPPWERVEAVRAVLGGETPVPGGIRLDLPLVSQDGSAVPLTVEVESPMTMDDHVEAIHLFSTGNPTPEIAVIRLTPEAGRARVTMRVRLNESQSVVAVARTNTGRFHAVARDVRVTVSGCLARGNDFDDASFMLARVRAPDRFSPGQPGEVLTLINHPMETGLRQNGDGNLIPQRIIHRVVAEVNGSAVMEAELHRSVAANPYLRFFVAPTAGGTLAVRWDEDGGESTVQEVPLRLP